MLNQLIQFSLKNRLLVVSIAALLFAYGIYTIVQLPVDVLPDLNRPRVTIFLEANGMAPEEIETQLVLPVETALNGAPHVEVVRSSSAIGIGMVFVEFDWNTDIYLARQLVSEKLQSVKLPNGIIPEMGPVSSVMGQIMLVGLTSDTTNAAELRTIADFTVRPRLMSIKGVAQVIPIGGDKKQYQILIATEKLKQFNISIDAIDNALQLSTQNTTGGFFNHDGQEVLIRNIGRATSLDDLKNTVIQNNAGQPVLLGQVADVQFGSAIKRGDAGINGKPAVILTVEKQPGANTIALTTEITEALNDLQTALPGDVKLNPDIFQQKHFIQNSITNVVHALRDGFILVIIILFLFLLNFRTTVITLTAIPLSIVITAVVFKLSGISINTLTLGGIAIAIGELVDDAIVDVENVFRRLKENRLSPQPKPALKVVYEASSEIRNSIVYATVIVVLVFIPLFNLQGMEGKIFMPLGIAYVTSIAASLIVSLTVTPALCSLILGKKNTRGQMKESPLVRWLKKQYLKVLHISLPRPKIIIGISVILIAGALATIPFFGSEFLPAFNEGSFTVNLSAPAGTSLEESNKIGTIAEQLILKVPEVEYTSRRTGRAELDEHVEPVSASEIEVELFEKNKRSRDEILADIRKQLEPLKGVSINIGQPISHRLEHLLSGVQAQVAIKLYGSDLNQLITSAGQIQSTIQKTEGVVDAQIAKQVMVPELLISIDRDALLRYGLQAGKVTEDLEVFYNGKEEGQIIDGQKTFGILLRAEAAERNNIDQIGNTLIPTGDGNLIPLNRIAKIEYTSTISSIAHENAQRNITVSCNIQGRDLGSAVNDIKSNIAENVKLPEGYYIEYGGQFESQTDASRLILILSLFSLLAIFLILFAHFRSGAIAAQIMMNIPLALVGSVIAVAITGSTFSVATMVGFITLTGIASRNGIMMISHYIHLMKYEGFDFGRELIIKGAQERLVPVMMTALVAALALIPLSLNGQAPGKEILHPVAVVILGGLISSTFLALVVTPVLFNLYGKKAIEKYISSNSESAI